MRGLLPVLVCAVLAGVAFPVTAYAATGSASASMLMGTVNVNIAGGTSLSLAVHPIIFACNTFDAAGNCTNPVPQQQLWNDTLTSAQGTWPGQRLDVYTIACWQFEVTSSFTPVQPFDEWYWKCASTDSGPATDLNSALAGTGTGTIGTSNLQCSWLGAYDPVAPAGTPDECASLTVDYNSIKPGVYSPVVPVDMMPSNLDPDVGSTVTFNILTNWCSYIAPAGWDIATHNGYDYYDSTASGLLGCANQEYPLGVGVSGSIRTLASTSNPRQRVLKLHIGASSYDCHVPRVKGLTLRKARRVLRAHHCSVGSVYHVKGKHPGRVRYQPLKVGTGRPKGYGVTLSVTRPAPQSGGH